MVYYRKYRPQTLQDLDKVDVRTRLASLFSKSDTPHAFLFTGSKGTGKTSTARIIAKIVNCTGKRDKKSPVEPCNKCSNCTAITNGNHLDVIEIDAASNRGIDEIRDLREKITYAPAMGRKKVYIIDEVHMLTKEAFNALLKTLEEPPSHALLILATTELHKLPDTIISRCTAITFTKATPAELSRSLGRIVAVEHIDIDQKTLDEIARRADGSFRDGAKLLEQTVAESTGTSITGMSYGQLSGTQSVEQFLSYVLAADTNKALDILENEDKQGSDFLDFNKRLLDVLHAGLLSKFGQGESADILLKVPASEIRSLLKLFTASYQEVKVSYIEQLPLELAVIEWGERKKLTVTS